MKTIVGLFLFTLCFLIAGVAMHFLMYDRAGVFVWSLDEDNRVVQTKLKAEGPALVKPTQVAVNDKGADKQQQQAQVEPAPEAPEPVAEPEAAEKPEQAEQPPGDPNVIPLFNGKDLGNWQITQYGGEGDVFVTEQGELEFGFGAILTGVHWNDDPPATSNYEITLEALKIDGTDFFCALTFPVKSSHATFVVGGWGGGIVGISSVDDLDASENETMNIEGFNDDQWYTIRVKVTDDRIEAWIDQDQMVDLPLKDRKISLRPGDIELSVPLGLASFQTRAKYRNLVWRNLPDATPQN